MVNISTTLVINNNSKYMLKLKKIILVTLCFFIILGCQNEKIESSVTDVTLFELQEKTITKESFKKSRYFKEDRVKDDKFDVIQHGSESAYNELCLYYGYNLSKKHELLPYTLIMIEKHKRYNYCTNAFDNLYEFYIGKDINRFYNGADASYIPYFRSINVLEPEIKNYCLYFLKLGYKNNDVMSIKYLEILYRNGFGLNKDINKANVLKEKYEQLSSLPKI
ncbi:Hypothetical lipoprotein [Flavobacterium branchiophilum]